MADTQFELITPSGADTLIFLQFRGQQALSQLDDFEIDCLNPDTDVDLDDLLGKLVSLKISAPDETKRYLSGYVIGISHLGTRGRYQAYRLQVQPWLWFLTRTADCRIFQGKTVPDIIKDVFADHAIAEVRNALTGSYSTWEYCVQYRESDYNFVSRLMEQEGIYYYFEYKKNKNVLVLADSYSAHSPIQGNADVDFIENFTGREESDFISAWSYRRRVQPGKTVLADFDFTKPSLKLEGTAQAPAAHGDAHHEIFDYPGEFDQTAEGKQYAQVRMDELQAQFELADGKTNSRHIAVGHLFKLKGHSRRDQNREYLVTRAATLIHNDSVESEPGAAIGGNYQCSFTALNSHQDFRPRRDTAKPIVQGPQTAIVVGASGDEIYTDTYGRVKVQFHWDRYGKKDEHSSCWVRVSHPWAGKNWGFVAIPRVGQEVIVEFLEGDPDQPIITGRVYNADQMPPYELPANKTQTGVKTRSSTGGGVANFNELRFEDKKGSEQIFIHAEKNQDIEVENDETHWIGHDRKKTIDHDETVHVKHDRTETVDNNETVSIGVNRTENVGADETVSIGANRTMSVGADEALDVGKNRSVAIGKNHTFSVGENSTTTVGKDDKLEVADNHTLTIGKDDTIDIAGLRATSIGKDDNLQVGKNLVIDAGDSVTIKTGSASITMKKDGTITIKGKDITIQGSGKVNVKASGDVVLKGSKIAEN